MKTFIKCASVLRIGFENKSIEWRREKVIKTINRFVEIRQPYMSIETCFV